MHEHVLHRSRLMTMKEKRGRDSMTVANERKTWRHDRDGADWYNPSRRSVSVGLIVASCSRRLGSHDEEGRSLWNCQKSWCDVEGIRAQACQKENDQTGSVDSGNRDWKGIGGQNRRWRNWISVAGTPCNVVLERHSWRYDVMAGLGRHGRGTASASDSHRVRRSVQEKRRQLVRWRSVEKHVVGNMTTEQEVRRRTCDRGDDGQREKNADDDEDMVEMPWRQKGSLRDEPPQRTVVVSHSKTDQTRGLGGYAAAAPME